MAAKSIADASESKFFLRSRTVIGGLIAALPGIAATFGYDWTAVDSEYIGAKLMLFLDQANEIVGFLVMMWGRQVAKGKLTWLPKQLSWLMPESWRA